MVLLVDFSQGTFLSHNNLNHNNKTRIQFLCAVNWLFFSFNDSIVKTHSTHTNQKRWCHWSRWVLSNSNNQIMGSIEMMIIENAFYRVRVYANMPMCMNCFVIVFFVIAENGTKKNKHWNLEQKTNNSDLIHNSYYLFSYSFNFFYGTKYSIANGNAHIRLSIDAYNETDVPPWCCCGCYW